MGPGGLGLMGLVVQRGAVLAVKLADGRRLWPMVLVHIAQSLQCVVAQRKSSAQSAHLIAPTV